MKESSSSLGGRLRRLTLVNPPASLAEASFEEIGSALLGRIADGAVEQSEQSIALGLHLQGALREALEIHGNRFSTQRYRDLFNTYYWYLNPVRPSFEGATIVDLGCGSLNPLGCVYLFLMLGARRGIAVDLDPIQDMGDALRTIVDVTSIMATTPQRIVGDYPISPETMLSNVSTFNMEALAAGDSGGLDSSKIEHRLEPADHLSLPDGAADLVVSNSFFEHVEDPVAVIRELARITRPGGLGIHAVDGTDHRRYGNSAVHMLEFLTEHHDGPLAHGSNRVRMADFARIFREAGFEILQEDSWIECEINEQLRSRLVPPFREMPDSVLQMVSGKLVVKKR